MQNSFNFQIFYDSLHGVLCRCLVCTAFKMHDWNTGMAFIRKSGLIRIVDTAIHTETGM